MLEIVKVGERKEKNLWSKLKREHYLGNGCSLLLENTRIFTFKMSHMRNIKVFQSVIYLVTQLGIIFLVEKNVFLKIILTFFFYISFRDHRLFCLILCLYTKLHKTPPAFSAYSKQHSSLISYIFCASPSDRIIRLERTPTKLNANFYSRVLGG